MKQYLELLDRILSANNSKDDRTGTGTISVFGHQMRFDLQKGFPLVTTKKVFIKGIIYELLWLLKGDTNVKYLQEHGVHIWDEWADANGDLGPVYGAQWRNWNNEGIDQIANVIESIKNNPNSRRHIVTAWNPGVLPDESSKDFAANVAAGKAALPPCHCFFQFYVRDGRLSCQIYIRANDMFLGAPFNIAEYALLTMMVADVCGLQPGELVYTIGDAHIYKNHIEQCKEQLKRTPYELPRMHFKHHDNIFDFKYEDFELRGYNSRPALKGEVSV